MRHAFALLWDEVYWRLLVTDIPTVFVCVCASACVCVCVTPPEVVGSFYQARALIAGVMLASIAYSGNRCTEGFWRGMHAWYQ